MRQAYMQLHLSVFLFGFTAILGAVIGLTESVLVWYRLGFTSIGFLAIGAGKINWLGWRDGLKLASIGWLLVLHWLCFFGAIKLANASVALICISTTSLFTALLEPLFRKKRFNPIEILLSLLIVIGIYLIFTVQKLYALGIIVGLLSALFSAFYSILNKKVVYKYSERDINFYEISGGWLLLTLIMPIYLHLTPDSENLTPTWSDLAYLLILSLLCTNFAYNLSLLALKKISTFNFVLAINLEPIYGIILAYFLLGENRELDARFVTGVMLVFSAVFLTPLMKQISRIRA